MENNMKKHTKYDLIKVPSVKLIEELNRRDLFNELDPQIAKYLLREGFRQCTIVQFLCLDRLNKLDGRNVAYSLSSLKTQDADEFGNGHHEWPNQRI